MANLPPRANEHLAKVFGEGLATPIHDAKKTAENYVAGFDAIFNAISNAYSTLDSPYGKNMEGLNRWTLEMVEYAIQQKYMASSEPRDLEYMEKLRDLYREWLSI